LEVLEYLYQEEHILSVFSQRKLICAYDIVRNMVTSPESSEIKITATMLILKSLYGPKLSLSKLEDLNFYRKQNITNQLELSMQLFCENFQQL
jgi:hypothetical protein